MINFLSSWVKNLALALIVVSILEMILPNNKTKKYVKMVMGLYILFCIISPFIENSDKFNFDNVNIFTQYAEETSSASTQVDQTSMDSRLNEIYIEQLQEDITQKIQDKGYEVERCKVAAHISKNDSGIENITLKIKSKFETENGDENSGDNNKTNNEVEDGGKNTETIENKIVTEIQKIQKVKIDVSKDNQENATKQENTNITKTDINIIKQFLINEYEVSEECLKIS